MKYKYYNYKPNSSLYGIPPLGYGIFDHKLEGGGIRLVEEIPDDYIQDINVISSKLKKKLNKSKEINGDD